MTERWNRPTVLTVLESMDTVAPGTVFTLYCRLGFVRGVCIGEGNPEYKLHVAPHYIEWSVRQALFALASLRCRQTCQCCA